jgi:hypothetical protein
LIWITGLNNMIPPVHLVIGKLLFALPVRVTGLMAPVIDAFPSFFSPAVARIGDEPFLSGYLCQALLPLEEEPCMLLALTLEQIAKLGSHFINWYVGLG